MASSYSISSSLNRSSKKSTVNDPKTCDCGFPARILTSTTPKNPGRHFMVCNEGKCKYWKWLDVELVQMPLMEVVEGMKAELVALKTEVEKVKEDMEQMKKEKYYDAIAMKEKIYKFTIGFLFLIIVYMMK
ncbi:uncharacterized protein LOC111905688 [Lactuca sativa]|uniref:GRF-type domain-containing protein n=1 Tax=Lactuca sativa TaxID=4236 RepID=A0A9R1V2H5_LACSA|nr:uncharacterized protein LOC111905688 [Lactuca sativa]KAJ0198530.1 hypothetical protein LSAT_V11C700385960 [Lactuca sativa]